MLFIIGFITVFASVIGGYTLHNGDLNVLWQPSEYLIIVGTVLGGFLISNPSYKLKLCLRYLSNLFNSKPYEKDDYLQLMSLCFNIFKMMKVKGMLVIESHIDNPQDSQIFNQSTNLLENERVLTFMRDYLRIMTMGVDNPYHFENLIDQEIETIENEELYPGKAFLIMGDSLPAIGIVAAVLGIIVTMGSIAEPPEILGNLIGAALIGTFAGVLLAYGIVLPIGYYLKHFGESKMNIYNCIRAGFLSHLNGNAPIITIEFMRKNIPESIKPDFYETDEYINSNAKNFT